MRKLQALRPSAAAFLLMVAMATTTSAISFFCFHGLRGFGDRTGQFYAVLQSDACGTYTPAMVAVPVLLVVALAAMLLALRNRKG